MLLVSFTFAVFSLVAKTKEIMQPYQFMDIEETYFQLERERERKRGHHACSHDIMHTYTHTHTLTLTVGSITAA